MAINISSKNDNRVTRVKVVSSDTTLVKKVVLGKPTIRIDGGNLQTLTDSDNIAWIPNTRNVAQVTLGGNRTLENPSTVPTGRLVLLVKQDSTGNRTLSYGDKYLFPSGITPTLSTTANAVDVLQFDCDGVNLYGFVQTDYR
jgi:hypothetical protein